MRTMVGHVRIKGFVWHLHIISKLHTLQRKTPQLAPVAISENQLKIAAMRTVLCSEGHCGTGWAILHNLGIRYL